MYTFATAESMHYAFHLYVPVVFRCRTIQVRCRCVRAARIVTTAPLLLLSTVDGNCQTEHSAAAAAEAVALMFL